MHGQSNDTSSIVGLAIITQVMKYCFYFVMTAFFLDDVIVGVVSVAQAFGNG